MTWFFKNFLSPSPGHFYNLTKNCARRPTFLAGALEISPCKDVCSSLHAEIKTACKEERTSLHAGISSAPARRLVCGAQITVRSKKCPGEGKRNFKKFQEISRYFKRFSKKFRKSPPALTLFSRPVTTTQRYWGLKIINIRMHFEMIFNKISGLKSEVFLLILLDFIKFY